MTTVLEDRVEETTATTGTGALALGGAVAGFRTFASVMSVGDTCHVGVEAVDASGVPTGDWATCLATYSAANQLTLTSTLRSSNSNAAVSWAAGTKRVFLDYLASEVSATLNVKSFGAKGDGSADDYAAIQAAITAALALGGATVYFPAGTYVVSASPTITHGKGINLLGEGPDRSIISAGAFPAMKTVGLWRSRIDGIGFWCNANTTGGAFQLDGEPDGSFGSQGNMFLNCYFFGNYNSKYVFTNCLISGGAGQCSENVWIGCFFGAARTNSGDALFFNNGANALNNTIMGSNFQSYNTGVLIASGNVDILHCGFQSTLAYTQIANGGFDVDCSNSNVGDTLTMTGCRTESLQIYKGGGNRAVISNFAQQQGVVGSWGAGTRALNYLCYGSTAAGNRKLYRVTTAGTTAGSEPTWPESGTVTDGSVVWTQLDSTPFYNAQGRVSNGQIQLGIFAYASSTWIENVYVTRDDCFGTGQFVSDPAPLISDLKLGGTPPPASTNRPIKIGNNNASGAKTSKTSVMQIGGHTVVASEGSGGGTYYDLELGRGGGDYNYKAGNWWQMRGGLAPGQIAFADISGATISNGVLFFVTDGTPGSNPLTGGGTGCLAIKQNNAWKAMS